MGDPKFKPCVKTQKNDATDAEAICEAMSRPGMRFVSTKTIEQQDIQAIHRVRSSAVGRRTAQGNQIRGLVAEYGLVAPQQLGALRKAIPDWLEDAENEQSYLIFVNQLACKRGGVHIRAHRLHN